MSRPSTGRTALVLHTARMSGPARSFARRLPLTTAPDERWVLVPSAGPAARLFEGEARVLLTAHAALAVPSGLAGVVRSAVRFGVDLVRFVRLFRSQRIQTVITATTYTPAAMLAARALGLRTVVYCGELLAQAGDRRAAKRAFAWLLRLGVERCAETIVCCSNIVARQFSPRANTHVVYPSIEVDGPHARPRTVSQPAVLAVVGSIARGRGQLVAIEALKLLRERGHALELLIAGTPGDAPDDRTYAQELVAAIDAAELGQVVRFLGHVDDVASLLGGATVTVNPAMVDEAFGRIAYEATAAGCPVVLSDTGGNAELLQREADALFFNRGDARGLADAIERLVEEPERAAAMAASARRVLPLVAAEAGDRHYLEALS